MLFKATLWTRELSLKKSTGILTYPHQTVMDRKKSQTLFSRSILQSTGIYTHLQTRAAKKLATRII
jgi:hypothetical protein